MALATLPLWLGLPDFWPPMAAAPDPSTVAQQGWTVVSESVAGLWTRWLQPAWAYMRLLPPGAQLAVSLLVLAVSAAVSFWLSRLSWRQVPSNVRQFVAPKEGPRFRKRDRLVFMSRRALRNAKAVGTYIRGGQGRKRRDVAKFVKRVFARGSPDAQSMMLRPDLPLAFLEEEGGHWDGSSSGPEGVPTSFVLVLKNLRVFGHVEHALLMELVKHMKHVTLRPGEFLFRVGEPDNQMYVVESGEVRVTCSPDFHISQVTQNKLDYRLLVVRL